MTTKQNDTAALTDEQLDGVAGGVMVIYGGMRVCSRSIEPNPSLYPRPWRTPMMKSWTPKRVRVGYRSIDPIPFP